MKKSVIAASAVSLLLIFSSIQGLFPVKGQEQEYTHMFFTLNLMVPKGNVNRENVGHLLAEELPKIGIGVNLHIIDFSDWLTHAYGAPKTWDEGGYDLFLVQTGYGFDPNGMYTWFHSKSWYPKGLNLYCYANPKLDELLDEGVKEVTNLTRRKEIYMEASKIIYEDLPMIPYWRVVNTFLLRNEVEGFEPNTDTDTCYNWSIPGKDYIKYVQPTDADNLLPLFMSTGYSFRAVGNPCFDGLVKFNESLQVVPDIAESWEWINTTYIVFHLRHNVYFHDGVQLTAEDVKFTYDAVMNPDTASRNYADYTKAIKQVYALDNFTVAFELNEPYAPFLQEIAMEGILPKHIMEKIPYSDWQTSWMNTGVYPNGTAAQIIGCGPYKYVEWKKDEYIKLEAFDQYYLGAPKTPTIYMTVIPDAATAYSALEAGEVDILNDWFGWTADDIHSAQENPDLKTASYSIFGPQLVGINLGHPILANKWVRWAINYMIPRQHIVDDLLGGVGGKAAYQFLSEETLGHNPNLPPIEYSIEKAKECMEKAGYLYEYITPAPSQPLPSWVYAAPIGTLVVGVLIGYAITALRRTS